MKYLRADMTMLTTAMIVGLIALGPTGGQLRAAADLGYGRHSMPWCTEHLGMADDRNDPAASEPALTETGQNDASTAPESSETSDTSDVGMDYENNDSFYGRGGPGPYDPEMTDEEYAGDDASASSAEGGAPTDDEAAEDEAGTSMEEETSSEDNYYPEGKTGGEPPADESTFVPSPSEGTTEEPTAEAMDAEQDASDAEDADEPSAEMDFDRTGAETSMDQAAEPDPSGFTSGHHPSWDRMFNEYEPDPSESSEMPEGSDPSTSESKPAEDSTSDASGRYEYSYPESRYGYGMEAEPAAEADVGQEPDVMAEEMYDGRAAWHEPSDESGSSYQESTWEEKYGYAEEMSGRTSDEEFADTEERADELSNAEMESADPSTSDAEEYTGTRGSSVEASEQGPASESAWDGGPSEADLDKGDWMPSENNDPVQNEAKPAEGLEGFGYLPSHLLIRPDQELLRELRCLADQSPCERQAAFRQYVESLGSEAIEFAAQYENATGEEAAMLSDDVASSAALLAVFRLYEQGELGIDEAIDLLRRTLDNLSQEWIDGVNEITAGSDFGYPQAVSLENMTDHASASVPRALWEGLSSWASQRAGQWKAALYGVWSGGLRNLDWRALVSSALADVDNYPMD